MARKARKVYEVAGKKFYDWDEYVKARNAYLGYQDEQEQAMAQSGFAKEIQVVAGEQSEIVECEQPKAEPVATTEEAPAVEPNNNEHDEQDMADYGVSLFHVRNGKNTLIVNGACNEYFAKVFKDLFGDNYEMVALRGGCIYQKVVQSQNMAELREILAKFLPK